MKTHTMKKFPFPVHLWSDWTFKVNSDYIHRTFDFIKSYSENQIASKTWLAEHLKMHTIADNKNKEVWILGSWYGTLLVPLVRSVLINPKIHLVDYDIENLEIAQLFHGRLYTHCLDVTFDLPELDTDIIINTSCEHMYPMKDIPMKGLCFYQSNNFTADHAHINCVNSVEELAEQSGIENPEMHTMQFHRYDEEHKRYMVIGRR